MDQKPPDLVRDLELETQFLPDCNTETVHSYHERQPYSRDQVSQSEHWRRLRKIGGGGFGTLWLERCTKGGHHGIELRAVKQLEMTPHSKRLDYSRELEAIAKFSQWKVLLCSLFHEVVMTDNGRSMSDALSSHSDGSGARSICLSLWNTSS